nr:patatin-like phospholipase family protein [Methylomonas sp. SURF-2]
MITTYFTHCWAAFEGGGVRAAAHAGAYEAAREAGIAFGRVAGTSGGSIVAALIAANASPKYLSDLLLRTDLSRFQSAADSRDSVFAERTWKLKLLKCITWGKLRVFAKVALNSGLYSSKPLEDWMEDNLKNLVAHLRAPGETGPIKFHELTLPLHIVATDLTTGKPKEWSKEKTPDEAVAFAVRCSCSIPFFYQAVDNKQSVLVDGGAVSNLPSFVFTELLNSGEGRSVLSRVLAFRLIEDANTRKGISDLADFAGRLSNAVIDGASYIQAILQQNTYVIPIPTGSIKSTDFVGVGENEKLQLHKAGIDAVRSFVSHERIYVRSSTSAPLFRGFDEKMLMLVQELQECSQVFFAVGTSMYWVDFIFPTLLSVARRGVQIVCVTSQPEKLDEKRRQWLLSGLGADIVYRLGELKPRFDGFVFDVGTDKASAILTTFDSNVDTPNSYAQESVRFYSHDGDPAILEMLAESLTGHWTQKPNSKRSLPYERISDLELFNRLKNVHQYAQAKFKLADVEVSDKVLVLQEAVKEFKLLQIKQHIQDLRANSCDLFEVNQVKLLNDSGTIVTPPVLERLNADTLVLIDGNTRFFHCLASGVKSVRAVIVEDVIAKLPAQHPKPLSSLRLISSTTTLADNYRNVERSLFRKIEEAVHPYD